MYGQILRMPAPTFPVIAVKSFPFTYRCSCLKKVILKRRTIHIKNRTLIFLLYSPFTPKYLKIEHHYRKIDLANKVLLAELCKVLLNTQ